MVADNTIILAITYTLIYLTIYKKNNFIGSILFLATSTTAYLIDIEYPAIYLILIAISILSIIYSILPHNKKSLLNNYS